MNTSKVEESATSNATRPAEVFDSCLTVNELSLYYGDSKALSDINLDIATKKSQHLLGLPDAESPPCCVASIE